MSSMSDRFRRLAAFAAIYFIWGSTYYAILVGLESFPPFLLTGIRLTIAAGLLAVIAWMREGRFEVNWRRAALLGVLFFPMGQGVVTWSEMWLPSGTVALLISTVPLWVALIDWIGGTRPASPSAVLTGLFLGLVGVGLLANPPAAVTGNEGTILHVFIAIGAALSWSVGTVLSRRIPASKSLFAAAASEMFIGAIVLTAIGLATGERIEFAQVSASSIAAVLYLVLFGSIVAFLSYTWLLERVAPYRVASYAYVNPLVAVLLGWAFADELVTQKMIGASVLIVTSVALVVLSGRQRNEEPTVTPTPQMTKPLVCSEPVLEP